MPIATATWRSYFALVDGKFVTLRVPYPLGFFAKSAEDSSTTPPPGEVPAVGRNRPLDIPPRGGTDPAEGRCFHYGRTHWLDE